MNAEKGHSQSADNRQLFAHKSSPRGGHAFKLKAPYKPTGDQPQAIAELVKGFKEDVSSPVIRRVQGDVPRERGGIFCILGQDGQKMGDIL